MYSTGDIQDQEKSLYFYLCLYDLLSMTGGDRKNQSEK